jgi:hypothetical protein
MVLLAWSTIYMYSVGHSVISYPSLVVIVLLIVLLFTKNKILGLLLSCVFAVYSLYLVLALVSDLQDADTFDRDATALLIKGSILIIGNLAMATLMFIKYLHSANDRKTKSA